MKTQYHSPRKLHTGKAGVTEQIEPTSRPDWLKQNWRERAQQRDHTGYVRPMYEDRRQALMEEIAACQLQLEIIEEHEGGM